MRIHHFLILALSSAAVLPLAGQWNAPDKNKRLADQAPGMKLVRMKPETLLKDACYEAMKKWKKQTFTDQDFAGFKDKFPADKDLQKRFPKSISPFARIKGVNPNPKVISSASYKEKERKYSVGLYTYCPFCCTNNFSVRFDKKDPNKAVSACCKTVLYREKYPASYKLKPNSYASIRFLDDSIRKIPCTLYKDKEGNEWELFIHHIFDHAYWVKIATDLVNYANAFKFNGNPILPYKAALILDHAADTYYALPLSFNNLLAKGKDGKELSRAEWENAERPIVFKHGKLGPWNRRRPFTGKGWINMHHEAIWSEPFALMRHHPAFRYYSKQKYGSEDALEKKIIRKLLREVILAYKGCFSQRLMTNYQEANYKDLLMAGILTQDRFVVEFAGANQELTLYNHHYPDGLNGEGAQNYMAMPGGYYYPYMKNPKGYGLLDKDFLKDNPFFHRASVAWTQLFTARGIQLEFGDQHQYIRQEFPTKRKAALLEEYRKAPSANYPNYGVGLLRVGSKDQRLEVSLHYSRATLHNASDMLGVSLWFDGVPVIRTGGYCSYWRIIDKKQAAQLNTLNFPRKAVSAPRVGNAFPWTVSHFPIEQNTVTVNDIPSGAGWADNRGNSQLITYKGGEPSTDPESGFQVLESSSRGDFVRNSLDCVREHRRALLGVETPDRRAYVVDLFTVHGGKNHTLFYSAWGEKAAGPEQIGKKYPTLIHAWFKGVRPTLKHPNRYTEWTVNNYYNAMKHVKDVTQLPFSPQGWTFQWNTDFYAYYRNAEGKSDAPRPAGSNLGKVSVRMTGVPVDQVPATLWHGCAPWSPAANRQVLPGKKFLPYVTVPFENAMEIFMQRRESKNGDLESRFVNVFEGMHPGASPVVLSVKKLLANRDQTVLEILLAGGYRDIVIYQRTEGRVKLPNGITTDARYALVRKDPKGKVVRSHMVRGTFLKEGRTALLRKKYAQFTGKIADITGDLTGDRTRSEMVITPDQKWDLSTLAGRDLYIITTREDGHKPVSESYRIASAKALPGGKVLLKFAHCAPFIAGWHQVMEFDKKASHILRTNRPMIKYGNQSWYEGAKVLFPARNKTYVIKDTEGVGGGYGGTFLTLRKGSDPAKDGIKAGDWYIIYSIEVGQKVLIPTFSSKVSR